MPKPQQLPEGRLIQEAIARQQLSIRRAAALVDLSDARLRQIINGYASAGRGHTVPVVAPPGTLARIGGVLGISPEEFESAGRLDAAEFMRTEQKFVPSGNWKGVHVVQELIAWLQEYDRVGGTAWGEAPPQNSLSLYGDTQLVQELSDRLMEREVQLHRANTGHPLYLKPGRFVVQWSETEESRQWHSEVDRKEKTDHDPAAKKTLRAVPPPQVEDDDDLAAVARERPTRKDFEREDWDEQE